LWFVKKSVNDSYGESYCEKNNANEIINICNELVNIKRDQYLAVFPVEKDLLIKIIFIFFEWLYKNKYTDHIIEENK
jgi:hypothetical protein